MYGTRPYNIWSGMKRRCYNKHEINYSRYGGKGVIMCDKWHYSFLGFWEDMKDTYFDNCSIDRINNAKGYSKDNCRWVRKEEQGRNRSQCRFYTHKGITDHISGWAKRSGLKRHTLSRRLTISHMKFEDAISKPLFAGTNKYMNLRPTSNPSPR